MLAWSYSNVVQYYCLIYSASLLTAWLLLGLHSQRSRSQDYQVKNATCHQSTNHIHVVNWRMSLPCRFNQTLPAAVVFLYGGTLCSMQIWKILRAVHLQFFYCINIVCSNMNACICIRSVFDSVVTYDTVQICFYWLIGRNWLSCPWEHSSTLDVYELLGLLAKNLLLFTCMYIVHLCSCNTSSSFLACTTTSA